MRPLGLCLLLCLLLGFGAAPLRAFEALDSVVTVWPVWPERTTLPPEEPQGTAVVIAPGGYLVTAFHVVGGASEIRVTPRGGPQLQARLLGGDPASDLALLKVEADLPALAPGPLPDLGARVCALGNPFGAGLSVSCGVVSARNRSGMGFNPVEDFIQTDAAINPGMSGGALVDAEGRLVGVLLAIFTRSADGDIGLNFAASHRLVERVVSDLKAGGKVRRAVPGFRVVALQDDERLRWRGARVLGVLPGGAAEAAGLRPGDILTAVDGRAVAKPEEVTAAVQLRWPGETLAIDYLRGGAAARTDLTLPE